MSLPHQQQEFVRCQAIELLSRLPAAARDSVRYYEVAALLKPFQPLPPLSGPQLGAKKYFYFVVTDWSIFVIPFGGSSENAIALELPCLCIRNLVRKISKCFHFCIYHLCSSSVMTQGMCAAFPIDCPLMPELYIDVCRCELGR